MYINIGKFRVSVKEFSLKQTYAGLYQGYPTKEINKSIINRAKDSISKTHGSNRPIHVVKPNCTPIEIDRRMKRRVEKIYNTDKFEMMPKDCFTVLLESQQTIKDPEKDGSYLFVIWFSTLNYEISLKEFLETELKNLDWGKYALDFSY